MTDSQFFLLKGVVAFVAIMLYAYHLWQIRSKEMPDDQRWRFIALFLGGVAVFYGSYEQIEDVAEINSRNVGGLVFATSLVIAAWKSVKAERKRVHEERLHGA